VPCRAQAQSAVSGILCCVWVLRRCGGGGGGEVDSDAGGRRVRRPGPPLCQRACYSASGIDGLDLQAGVPVWCKALGGQNIGVVVVVAVVDSVVAVVLRRGHGPASWLWYCVVAVVLRYGRGPALWPWSCVVVVVGVMAMPVLEVAVMYLTMADGGRQRRRRCSRGCGS
jgi:hypothetical protein